MSDPRSRLSEQFAFDHMGVKEMIASEVELVRNFVGNRVPEGIFVDPEDCERTISIEVKRIIGGRLPPGAGGRRYIRRRGHGGEHIIWPWTSSVEVAISKLSDDMSRHFSVSVHHAVFLVPKSVEPRTWHRTLRHIKTTAERYMAEHKSAHRIKTHVIKCDDSFFDRR